MKIIKQELSETSVSKRIQLTNTEQLVSVKEHKDSYIEKYSPKEMYRSFSEIKTIKDAISNKSDGLSLIKKKFGTKFTEALLKVHLIHLNEMSNAKNPLTENMIEYTANEILSIYWFFTMSDIYLIFRKILNGEYGEFYGSISPVNILSCFLKYAEDRFNIAKQMSLNKHLDTKDVGDSHRRTLEDFKRNAFNQSVVAKKVFQKELEIQKNKDWVAREREIIKEREINKQTINKQI